MPSNERWQALVNDPAALLGVLFDHMPMGIALFDRLRHVAVRHDARLRSQLTEAETAQLGELLDRLRAGIEEQPSGAPVVAGEA